MTPEEEKNLAAQIIGGFLVNFGAVEHMLFQWVRIFSTDQIIRDIVIDLPLNKRLKLICELIQRSNLSEEQKNKALLLWAEVERISKTRNIIAHNPFITHKNQHGFIDVKKLKGAKEGDKIPMEPLLITDIANAGKRLSSIFDELVKPL